MLPDYVRNDFLKKVYAILSVQLLITAAGSGLIMLSPSLRHFAQHSQGLMLMVFVASLGCICALHVYKDRYPYNLGLLMAFTVLESYMVGTVCTRYDTESVLAAVVL